MDIPATVGKKKESKPGILILLPQVATWDQIKHPIPDVCYSIRAQGILFAQLWPGEGKRGRRL